MTELWDRLREACEHLDPGSLLVTPVSERPFGIESTLADRVDVRFRDSGEVRSLHREQFAVLEERLQDGPLSLEAIPPGVEPYVSVLSISPMHTSTGETLSRVEFESGEGENAADVGGDSPHLVSPEAARTRPERVHDDAVLLADALERLEVDDPASLDTEALTDLYVLLSDVQHGSDRVRRDVREPLLERLGPGQQLHGRLGTVRRTTRRRRTPKDDETVLDALDEHGIPHEWVLGVDRDKLDVVLAVTDVTEDAVYDTTKQVYVQKTGVDESEKVSRLRGLADRLAELEGGDELEDDLVALEDRLEDVLSAG